MAITYEPIATTTLGSASSTITFSSIPSTYTDLRIVLVGTTTVATNTAIIRFNSDSGTNYSYTYLYGNGVSAASGRGTSSNAAYVTPASGFDTTIPSMCEIDIFSYAGSTYKTLLSKGSFDANGSGTTETAVNLWRSTSAINSIAILTNGGTTYKVGTTATLYGIKAA